MSLQIDLHSIDKSNWKTFRFDQLAKSISERVDPSETDLDRYVGLEHLDPETVHLYRYGSPADVKGQKLKCYEGDVIFGKRRAYQRKAVVVDFDGICSAHAFVLRANPEVILPSLFPFFLHSDAFMHRAVDISVGGLSPTINWKNLREQEFLLPPKDQQAALAELLWAMDAVVEGERKILKQLERTLETTIEKEIHGVQLGGNTIQVVLNEVAKNQQLTTLNNLGELLKGRGIPKSEVVDSGTPCVRYGELYTKHHRIIRKFHSFIDEPSKVRARRLMKNDVLFAGSGETISEIGKSAVFVNDFEAYVGSDTIVFRPKEMDGYFLGYLLNSQLVRQQLNKFGTGATVIHIYVSDLEKIQVPVIPKEKQVRIGQKLEVFATNIQKAEMQITSSQSLLRSLINQIF